jgi:hypothetical protein
MPGTVTEEPTTLSAQNVTSWLSTNMQVTPSNHQETTQRTDVYIKPNLKRLILKGATGL